MLDLPIPMTLAVPIVVLAIMLDVIDR